MFEIKIREAYTYINNACLNPNLVVVECNSFAQIDLLRTSNKTRHDVVSKHDKKPALEKFSQDLRFRLGLGFGFGLGLRRSRLELSLRSLLFLACAQWLIRSRCRWWWRWRCSSGRWSRGRLTLHPHAPFILTCSDRGAATAAILKISSWRGRWRWCT